MTEDNNVFGEFGVRSSKFDELLKKYQTIDENGRVVSNGREQPSAQAVKAVEETVTQPSEDVAFDCVKEDKTDSQPDYISDTDDFTADTEDFDNFCFDGLDEEDDEAFGFFNAEPVAEPAAQPIAEPVKAAEEDDDEVFGFFKAKPVAEPAAQPIAEPVKAAEEDDDEAFGFFKAKPVAESATQPIAEPVKAAEEDDDEAFGFFKAKPVAEPATQPIAEPEVSKGFVFDAQARFSDDSAEEQSEPDYSYDINTFGKSKYGGALDIDSFDDSWLDTAFDESMFYKAKDVVDNYQVKASDPVSARNDKLTQSKNDRDMYEVSSGYKDFDIISQSDVGTSKNVLMTGGYVAPSSVSDFEFDPDSGLDFYEDDGLKNEPERSNRGSLVSKLKKKLRKKDL